jgi:hypothetical protein
MTTYPVRSRRLDRWQWVIGTIFFGALFAMTVLPVLTGDAPAPERPGRISVFAVFVLIGYSVNAWERRKVSETRIADDGTIQLVRGNGKVTTLAAQDVRELEGEYSRDYDGWYTVWNLSLRDVDGTFTFGEFPSVMDFVEKVRTHHPGVRITGLWPMASP